jgi:hypothetical protein
LAVRAGTGGGVISRDGLRVLPQGWAEGTAESYGRLRKVLELTALTVEGKIIVELATTQ